MAALSVGGAILGTVASVAASKNQAAAAQTEGLSAKYQGIFGAIGARMQGVASDLEAAHSAFAAAVQGMTAEANFKADAAISEFNAKIAREQARDARNAGKLAASQFRFENKAKLAAARTARNASGFTLEGSPALIDEATFAAIEGNAANLTLGGEIIGTRLDQQGKLLEVQAKIANNNAGFARTVATNEIQFAKTAGSIATKSAEIEAKAALIGAGFKRTAAKISASTAKIGAYSAIAQGAASVGGTLSERGVSTWGIG